MIYGVGMLDSALTWDYASAMLQNEFLDMVLKVVNGIQISEANIAYDVIKEVGPGGNYPSEPSTLSSIRSDEWFLSDYLVVWMMNPSVTQMSDAHFLYEAKYNGSELVVIDPQYSATAVHADQWLPLRSATDAGS